MDQMVLKEFGAKNSMFTASNILILLALDQTRGVISSRCDKKSCFCGLKILEYCSL